MAIQQFKMILAFVIIFTYGELAKADTKVIRILVQRSSRGATTTLLEKDKDLVIKLLLLGLLETPNHYMAVKNGYRPKDNHMVKDGYTYGSGGFSARTLQSLAG